MKALTIDGQKVADYCTKYDDGTVTVTVPHLLDMAKNLVLNTEVTVTSAASKNAKGAISSMIKVSAPYQAFDKDLVTGDWVPNKRRSGAPVSCHLVLTIPAALAADADAGCDYARKQLILMDLMLQKHMGALAADVEAAIPMSGENLQGLAQDDEVDSEARTRLVALPRWSVVGTGATRLGRAVKVEEDPKDPSSFARTAVAPTDEDVSISRALTGKRLIDCDTPTYTPTIDVNRMG